jgi:hypothetical protein
MDPNPTCRTCGALVELTRRNAVTPVIYRNVMCRGCGVICILEGPERNVSVAWGNLYDTALQSQIVDVHRTDPSRRLRNPPPQVDSRAGTVSFHD